MRDTASVCRLTSSIGMATSYEADAATGAFGLYDAAEGGQVEVDRPHSSLAPEGSRLDGR